MHHNTEVFQTWHLKFQIKKLPIRNPLSIYRYCQPILYLILSSLKKWVHHYAISLGLEKENCKRRGIKDAAKYLNFSVNKDEKEYDKRRSSTEFAAGKSPLSSKPENKYKSPQAIDKETSGKQGTPRYKKALPKDYHEAQVELFQLEGLDSTYDVTGKKLKRKEDGKELSPDEFCKVIREEMIKKWHTKSAGEIELGKVMEFLEYGVRIVHGRFASQHISNNNLSQYNGWLDWKNHTVVLIAFSVYCGVLDKYVHDHYRECGFKKMLKQDPEVDETVDETD